MKTIGLIGGMSWESSAVYYRRLNEAARERLGGLHSASVVLWSFDFAEIEALQAKADWEVATSLMVDAATRLERAGAECLLIGANTMHLMADDVQAAVAIPLLHIADAAAAAMRQQQVRRPLLLGTRFTMEQDFYAGRLRDRHGIDTVTPDSAGRKVVHEIIYEELCRGVVAEQSRRRVSGLIAEAESAGADSVVFACTEIGLLLDPGDVSLPVFDTTELHVGAAVDFALA